MRWVVVSLASTVVACGAEEPSAALGVDGSVDEPLVDGASNSAVDSADVKTIDAGPYQPWNRDAACVRVARCPETPPTPGSPCPFPNPNRCDYGTSTWCGLNAWCAGPIQDSGALVWNVYDRGPCAPVVSGGPCPTTIPSYAPCSPLGTVCMVEGLGNCVCGNDPNNPSWNCTTA